MNKKSSPLGLASKCLGSSGHGREVGLKSLQSSEAVGAGVKDFRIYVTTENPVMSGKS